MDISRLAGLALAVILIAAAPAAAQVAPAAATGTLRASMVEGAVGWTGFADDSVIHHTLLGVAARYYLTRRISVGPELQHMVGPGSDRDTLLTGNIVVDLLAPTATPSAPHHALRGRGRRPVQAHVAYGFGVALVHLHRGRGHARRRRARVGVSPRVRGRRCAHRMGAAPATGRRSSASAF